MQGSKFHNKPIRRTVACAKSQCGTRSPPTRQTDGRGQISLPGFFTLCRGESVCVCVWVSVKKKNRIKKVFHSSQFDQQSCRYDGLGLHKRHLKQISIIRCSVPPLHAVNTPGCGHTLWAHHRQPELDTRISLKRLIQIQHLANENREEWRK